MLQDLLGGIFAHLVGERDDAATQGGSCGLDRRHTVDYVVDKVASRLRAMPRYQEKLAGPVATSIDHVDRLAEMVPGPILCSRAAFLSDPTINAFFVNPDHLQDVISRSQDVRSLFDANPSVEECWGLLCLRMDERRRPGLALEHGALRHDVMQTTVSFTDHQIVSPGTDETSARCALKCCMFNALLAHIRHTAANAQTQVASLEDRLRARRRQLQRLQAKAADSELLDNVLAEIGALESQLANTELRLPTINHLLDYVAEMLGNPSAYVASRSVTVRINQMGIKLQIDSDESGHALDLIEFRIAGRLPRIGTLFRFPRIDLLAQSSHLECADLFLAL